MEWQVRRLSGSDQSAFRKMNALFGSVFEDPVYAAEPPSDSYVDRLLADDKFIALIVEEDGDVVGALAAYEMVKFEAERSEIYIYDLGVAERFRRTGMATAMIEWLKHHARGVGAWMIFVQADPPDEPAVALYDRLGVREEVLHFDIAPSDGDPTARP